jgi:hypothetical protein
MPRVAACLWQRAAPPIKVARIFQGCLGCNLGLGLAYFAAGCQLRGFGSVGLGRFNLGGRFDGGRADVLELVQCITA